MSPLHDLRGKRIRTRVLSSLGPEQVAWLPDATVSVDADGRIDQVAPGGPADLDLRPAVLTAGFVDAHVHFPQTRIIGSASGPLLQWLERSTFPEEARFADPDHAASVARAFVAALAAAGTTLSFVYSSVHPAACDALLGAMDRRGLRTIAGPVLMDHGPPGLCLPTSPALAALDDLVQRHHGRDGRLQVAVIPRFALSCTPKLLQAAGAFARDRGLWVSTHLSENPEECATATAMHGTADYLQVYEDAGMVHDRSVYAHCIHLSDSEWSRLQQAGAVIAHCPDSNDFLGSGTMDRGRALDLGVPVALGTDVAAGRSFRVPRIASSAYDAALRHGRMLPPALLLHDATRGGAAALGHPDQGAVQAGFQADLVLHDLPAWVDDADAALAWLLFHHDAPPPRGTWVAGRQVWDRDAHWRAGGVYPWDPT